MGNYTGEDKRHITKDNIYGKVMEPFEERMSFFERKDIKVNGDKHKDEDFFLLSDKAGVEQLIQDFSIPMGTALVLDDPDTFSEYQGSEGLVQSIKTGLVKILELAKDAVEWLMGIINNKLIRLDNRQFRVNMQRKRYGLVQDPVRYPATTRRLMLPNRITEDGQWVYSSLKDVEKFYESMISAYDILVKVSSITPDDFVLEQAMGQVIAGVTKALSMTPGDSNSDGSRTYLSGMLPGNKYFRFDAFEDGSTEIVGLSFDNTMIEVKLKSKTFLPTPVMIDKTLDKCKSIVGTIRKNQSSVGTLHRAMERNVVKFAGSHEQSLTPDHRAFLAWIIRFNKRMCSLGIQYSTAAIDAGLDFCSAGIAK